MVGINEKRGEKEEKFGGKMANLGGGREVWRGKVKCEGKKEQFWGEKEIWGEKKQNPSQEGQQWGAVVSSWRPGGTFHPNMAHFTPVWHILPKYGTFRPTLPHSVSKTPPRGLQLPSAPARGGGSGAARARVPGRRRRDFRHFAASPQRREPFPSALKGGTAPGGVPLAERRSGAR